MTNWFAAVLACQAVRAAIDRVAGEGASRIVLDRDDRENFLVLPKGYDRESDPDGLIWDRIGEPLEAQRSVSSWCADMIASRAHAAAAAALDAIHGAAKERISQVEYRSGEQHAMDQAKIFYGVMGDSKGASAWGEAAGNILAARLLGDDPDLSSLAGKLPDFGLPLDRKEALGKVAAKVSRMAEPMELAYDEEGISLSWESVPELQGGPHA